MIRRHLRIAQALFWSTILVVVMTAGFVTDKFTRRLVRDGALAVFAAAAIALGVERFVLAARPPARTHPFAWRDLLRRYEVHNIKPRTLLLLEGGFAILLGLSGLLMVVQSRTGLLFGR